MNIIYGLIDSDTLELRYVGQTIQPLAVRVADHKRVHGSNLHLQRWLAKYPVSIITLERDVVDLNEAERRWIAEMRGGGARLLNLTDGGDGRTGPHTSETRAKMRAAALGRRLTPETCAKLSAAKKGRTFTAEHRAKISAALRGRTLTLEHRAKISTALRGHVVTLETRAKISAAKRGYMCTA